jgi:hypothetical protein
MDIESRINGQFGRFEFNLERQGNGFIVKDTIQAFGKIGVEIWAHDKLNGATNRNGIPTIYMSNNGDEVFNQEIDNVNFSSQKQILVHTNFQAQKTTNRRYNKLYIDDGNTLKFYDNKDHGFLFIEENAKNHIGIQMIDTYENERKINFNILGEAINDKITSVISPPKIYSVQDNTLILTREVEDSDLENITIYTKENSRVLGPTYSNQNHHIYLWDLRTGLPDSVNIGNHSMDIMFNTMVPSTSSHSYDNKTYALSFSNKSLFDTTYIQSQHYIENQIEIFELHNQNQPVKNSFGVEIDPLLQYDSLEQHHIFKLNSGKNPSFIGGVWDDGKIKFSVTGPGKYTLMKDEKPPSIKELSRSDTRISFRIQDKQSGIKEFRAEINGEWLLMNYDSKRNLIWSERLDKKKNLKGNFSLTILDNAGNESNLIIKL